MQKNLKAKVTDEKIRIRSWNWSWIWIRIGWSMYGSADWDPYLY
jgi:hypothetical protein